MIEIFLRKFNIITKSEGIEEADVFYKDLPSDLFEVLHVFGGSTFNNGLYRLHTLQSSFKWASIIGEYFTHYNNKIYPFGFDWMGRQFCLGIDNNTLFMFDPATAEDFELNQSLILLHNEDFVNDTNEMLSIDAFNETLSFSNLTGIGYNECFGYKTPLFLGGQDQINNYEVQDIEVYWSVTSQIYRKIKDLPDGTKINSIKIE